MISGPRKKSRFIHAMQRDLGLRICAPSAVRPGPPDTHAGADDTAVAADRKRMSR